MAERNHFYTKEKQNGIRLGVLICDIATEALRNVFHDTFFFPRDPKKLFDRLKSFSKDLEKLKRPRGKVLSNEEWEILFPPEEETFSEKFDLTLLVVLLRTCGKLQSPRTGWDEIPDEHDRCLGASVVRLRKLRNELRAHVTTTDVTKTEFQEKWKKIEPVLLDLGCSRAVLNQVRYEPLTADQLEGFTTNMAGVEQSESLLIMYDLVSRVTQLEESEQNSRSRIKSVEEEVLKVAIPSVNELKLSIRSFYRDVEKILCLAEWDPDIFWDLEKIYVKLKLIRGPVDSTKKVCGLFDVFKPHSGNESPKRIVILGDAGMGKTTACKKLAIEFGRRHEDFEINIKGVHFLLFVRCRELSGNFFEKVAELLLGRPCDSTERDQLIRLLCSNAKNVLFVIDGLDEIPDNNMNSELEDLLNGKLIRGCRIIATTRPKGLKSRQSFFHSQFKIQKFKDADVSEYVGRYFSKSKSCLARELTKVVLDKENQFLVNLSLTPLNLSLLCLLWEDNQGVLPETLSELYTKLFRCLTKRFIAKKRLSCQESDINSTVLFVLKQLAYASLKKGSSYFDDNELNHTVSSVPITFIAGMKLNEGSSDTISKYVVQFGLVVSAGKASGKLSNNYKYEFTHRSCQEFLCAQVVRDQLTGCTSANISHVCADNYWIVNLYTEYGNVYFERELSIRFLLDLLDPTNLRLFLIKPLTELKHFDLNGFTCSPVWKVLSEVSNDKRAELELCRYLPVEVVMTSSIADIMLHNIESFSQEELSSTSHHCATKVIKLIEDDEDVTLSEAMKQLYRKMSKIIEFGWMELKHVNIDGRNVGETVLSKLVGAWKLGPVETLNIIWNG